VGIYLDNTTGWPGSYTWDPSVGFRDAAKLRPAGRAATSETNTHSWWGEDEQNGGITLRAPWLPSTPEATRACNPLPAAVYVLPFKG